MTRRTLLGLVKLAATAGLLAWLSTRVDWTDAVASASQIPPAAFAIALLLHVLALALMGVRWWLLLRCTWPALPLNTVFPSYYLGVSLNLVLPSGIGGDVARTLHLRWHGLHWPPLVSSMIVDKALGLASVILMGAIATTAADSGLPESLRGLAAIAIGVSLAAGSLLMTPLPERWLQGALARRTSKVGRGAARVVSQCLHYRTHSAVVALTVLLSLLSQSLVISAYWVLGRALGLELAAAQYFVFVPVLFLVTAMPISIGGLGVREATLVALATAAGATGAQAAALALAYFLVLWNSSLPGLLGLLKTRPQVATVPPVT